MKKEKSVLTDHEQTRLKVAERNIKVLEQRLITVEEQLTLCLRFIRIHAEKLAKEKNPEFVPHDEATA